MSKELEYRSRLVQRIRNSRDLPLFVEYFQNVLLKDAENERDALDVLDNSFSLRYALINGELDGYRKFLAIQQTKEKTDA